MKGFKIISYSEFQKICRSKGLPETIYLSNNDPGIKYATSGFILNRGFGGCTSVAVLAETGGRRSGFSTHYEFDNYASFIPLIGVLPCQ